ncbi:MAG TPA: serine/threonine-protein kinase [Ktedonobacteraceae bacterium]|nr:serine/threonine-protein kinase [Ktedonobacteraceae bacterium]
MDNYVGEKLGNYCLTRLLGSGGFAEVYLGEHMYLKTQAAIKLLRVSLEEEALAQFLTEARTIAHLEHPNIVRILEFGVQGSTPYLVMNYAPNGTVLGRYPRGSVVPLHMVIQYARQIADALQYAHARELIHRDVKPENMLLGRDGEIFLSDFGLAVMSPGSQSRRPLDKAGTTAYMAPEQIEGKPSKSSDQYALGVVVYEWLCGSLPFTGSDEEIEIQHLQVPPPPLCERAPSVPSAIEQVVMKALAKDPSQRFLSVLHFAQVLEEAYQPYKLVRLLPNMSSVDTKETPFKQETHRSAEPEPSPGPLSPTVLDDDMLMSSAHKRLTRQAEPEPSVRTPRRISRRMLLIGLAALTVVSVISGIIGAGAVWSFRNLGSPASSSRGSSSIVQPSNTSQATPGTSQFPATTNSSESGSSTPSATPGNSRTIAMQHVHSTSKSTSASTAMPTAQATSTSNNAYPSISSLNGNNYNTSSYNNAPDIYSTPTPTPTPTPALDPTPTPTPQSQPTPPGHGKHGAQGQQGNQ